MLYLKISINDFFNQNISNEEVTLDLNNYNIDNIYKNLAYYREKSKLTLKELSKKIKISIQRLSDFELGKALPSIEEFITLCNFYNLNYEELFLINNETNLIPNNNQKITKQKAKKIFLCGFSRVFRNYSSYLVVYFVRNFLFKI
ncbi:MAG: helix-turn-helix transcriptional regulator [bacterium]|nr:helix-turn-helix transcriptional regulator [bacterium]